MFSPLQEQPYPYSQPLTFPLSPPTEHSPSSSSTPASISSSSAPLGLMSMAAVETLTSTGLGHHDFTRAKMYQHYSHGSLNAPLGMSSLSPTPMLSASALSVPSSAPSSSLHHSLSRDPHAHAHSHSAHSQSSHQAAAAAVTSSPTDATAVLATKPNYASTHTLSIRQQPVNARVAIGKEKDRKPIDPPPILQLSITTEKDPHQHFLQSPYFFMTCTLVGSDSQPLKDVPNTSMVGSLASSLHKLKDTDNSDGGFFIFPDLSVKVEGKFRLQFSLFEFQGSMCSHIASTTSEVFTVWPSKTFPGMAESTFLTRSFSDQGVRLRLRKDSRSVTSRKRSRIDDFSNPRYAGRSRTSAYDASTSVAATTLPRLDSSLTATTADSTHSASPQNSTPRQASFGSPYAYDARLSESRGTVSSVATSQSQSQAPYYYGSSYVTSSSYPSVTSGLSLQGLGSSVASSMYPSQSSMTSVSSLSPYTTDAYGHHESPTFAATAHDLHFRTV